MNRRWQTAVLSAGFAFTGLACALPGVLLPVLLPLWHWNDQQGGRFFLVIALGSATGPLLLGSYLRRALLVGFVLVAAATVAWTRPSIPHTIFALVWGLGLGLIMTSISLITSQRSEGPEGADGSGTALGRINFLWSAGACLCPLLVTSAIGRLGVYGILLGCAGLVVLLWTAASLLPQYRASRRTVQTESKVLRLPVSLVAAAVLATGVEASAGAWLATYASRFEIGAHAVLALPALFWGGLLSSRAFSWRKTSPASQTKYLRALFAMTAAASFLLLIPFHRLIAGLAAFCLGFGLGPLFPELLARVLMLRQTRSVFFLAGVTSAVLPWATGVVSQQLHSLVMGMLVPCLSSVGLLVFGWRAMTHEARRLRALCEGSRRSAWSV